MGFSDLSHVPCKFFRQGTCQAGKACPFSHSVDPSSDQAPCKYFQKASQTPICGESSSNTNIRVTANLGRNVLLRIYYQMEDESAGTASIISGWVPRPMLNQTTPPDPPSTTPLFRRKWYLLPALTSVTSLKDIPITLISGLKTNHISMTEVSHPQEGMKCLHLS